MPKQMAPRDDYSQPQKITFGFKPLFIQPMVEMLLVFLDCLLPEKTDDGCSHLDFLQRVMIAKNIS
jgi:hypothetical protein